MAGIIVCRTGTVSRNPCTPFLCTLGIRPPMRAH